MPKQYEAFMVFGSDWSGLFAVTDDLDFPFVLVWKRESEAVSEQHQNCFRSSDDLEQFMDILDNPFAFPEGTQGDILAEIELQEDDEWLNNLPV